MDMPRFMIYNTNLPQCIAGWSGRWCYTPVRVHGAIVHQLANERAMSGQYLFQYKYKAIITDKPRNSRW